MENTASNQSSQAQPATDVGLSTRKPSSGVGSKKQIDRALVVRLYKNPAISTSEICAFFEISTKTLYEIINSEGIKRRRKSTSRQRFLIARRNKAITLFSQGMSKSQIAKECGVSRTAVNNWLKGHTKGKAPTTLVTPVVQPEPKRSLFQRIRRWFGG